MRRIVFILLLFALVCAGGQSLALETAYQLEELEVSLSVPDDLYVLTRASSDAAFEALGLSKEEMLQTFALRRIYLDAIWEGSMTELIITMSENSGTSALYQLNEQSPEKIEELALSFMRLAEDMLPIPGNVNNPSGRDVFSRFWYTNYSVYTDAQVPFIVLEMRGEFDGAPLYGRQYYTVVNGRGVYLTLQSFDGEISQAHATQLLQIVDSCQFVLKPSPVEVEPKYLNISLTILFAAALIGFQFFRLRRRGSHKGAQQKSKQNGMQQVCPEASEKRLEAPLTPCRRCLHCGRLVEKNKTYCPHCGKNPVLL